MITEQREQARRNYALEAYTLGEENFLQIRCGDEILVTVTPADEESFFAVFNGNGLTDEDDDLPLNQAVKLFATGDRSEAWRQAARFGYQHALAKMMTQDAREERELYGLAA